MSQENVEVVREATDVFNRLGLNAFMALLSPDVVWEVNPELPGLREVYCGLTEVREFQADLLDLGEDIHVEVCSGSGTARSQGARYGWKGMKPSKRWRCRRPTILRGW